ncbi:acyltransferase [Oceanobacillus chungangensis]|uniref:Acyltransferase n=2 Tax=Oceanobacillus chungangensis TaxID=1229152 RepID=A0A3D8PI90_9BACI|nr:acyltransferase [Oceanobacillus chungangensis]
MRNSIKCILLSKGVELLMIHEWNVLRVAACLSIVLLHSTTEIILINGNIDNDLFQLFRVLLAYATPTFVLLSIIIIANRYKDKTPANFLKSRFKFILLPFVFFAFIYALNGELNYPNYNLTGKLLKNIFIGDFTGWFVLAIFQLYLIFWLIKKTNVSTIWLIPSMFFVGLLFLTFVNNVHIANPDLKAVFRIIFPTWLAYFAVAYLIGKYYNIVIDYLIKYRYITILLVLVSIGIIAINFSSGNTSGGSRRLDLLPFVISMTLMILAFGKIMPRVRLIDFISNYAFGIYLLHRLVQFYIAPYTAKFSSLTGQIGSLFIISLLICILIIRLVSYLPFSAFMIGKIRGRATTNKNQQTVLKKGI